MSVMKGKLETADQVERDFKAALEMFLDEWRATIEVMDEGGFYPSQPYLEVYIKPLLNDDGTDTREGVLINLGTSVG